MFSAWFFLGRELAFCDLFSACVVDGVNNRVGIMALSVYQGRIVVEQVL